MENFEIKSAEILAAMTAEELAGYYNGLNEAKTAELASIVESKATKEDIESLKNEIKSAQIEQMKSLNETLKQQGLAIKKVADREASDVSLLTEGSIRKELEKNKEIISKLRDTGGKLVFKAPATMLGTTNVSGGNVPVEQRIPGLDIIASRTIRLMDFVTRGTADSNIISWVSQANKDGAAGPTAEGAIKNQIDFDLVVDSESLKKFTAYVKISDEMKDDISFIESEINNELAREVLKVVESQVYAGDGNGNNLNGISTVASAFVAATAPEAVQNANEVDVLRTAATQIKVAEHDGPTVHFVHPTSILALKNKKVGTADDRYINQLQEVAGTLMLDGVPLVETTLVTAGEYLTGNFKLATVYDKGSMNIEMGLDADDFTKNLMTIRGEWRGLVVVKTNERSAFVKGVFATDKAALEAL